MKKKPSRPKKTRKKTVLPPSGWADNFEAASKATGATRGELRSLKRSGSSAFRHGRIHIATLLAELKEHRDHRAAAPPLPPPLVKTRSGGMGVGHTYERLKEIEKTLHAELLGSIDSRDPASIADCRRNWLATVSSLRQYELSIDEQRRIQGETVSRREVDNGLKLLAMFWRLTGTQVAAAAAGDLAGETDVVTTRIKLQDLLFETWLWALTCCRAHGLKDAPAWIIAPFTKELAQLYSGVEKTIEERAPLLTELVSDAARRMLEQINERAAALKLYPSAS